MKILRVHLVEIMVAVLFVLIGYSLYAGSAGMEESGGVPFNEGWTCASGESQAEYPWLPKSVPVSKEADGVVLSKELDASILSNNTIGFYSSHQIISACIDGAEIYRFQVPEGSKSKTPGSCWNFIPLQDDYAGKILEIHIRSAYPSGTVRTPRFILGMKSEIRMAQVRQALIPLAISMVLLMLGLMLVITWFSIGKKMHFSERLQWIGLFSVHFSIWSALETGIPILMFGNELLFEQASCLSLKLMLMPLLCFIQSFYRMEENRNFNLLIRLTVLDFAISFYCQPLGWLDFHQTMWLTHALTLLGAAATLCYGAQLLLKRSSKLFADKQRAFLNLAGVLLAVGCILADGWHYFSNSSIDQAAFSRLGCLAFALIQVFQFLQDSVRLIAAGQEVETIREEAETDGLTMMKNRRTFEASLRQIKPENYGKYSFVLFDLNNLKKMNDTYGHGMGDCYIITASEVIQDMFGEFGDTYRIGGDEFCLVSDRLSREAYEKREQQMNGWIESLQGSQVKDFMQIASGFAAFNKSKDVNLQDTLERADGKMYQKKKEQKQQRLQHEI